VSGEPVFGQRRVTLVGAALVVSAAPASVLVGSGMAGVVGSMPTWSSPRRSPWWWCRKPARAVVVRSVQVL